MSTVDVRVVEMRFDNKQFESGVQTSLGTLDKLKSSLKLDGATSGLKQIEQSARSLDFSALNTNVQSVADRFSSMGIVGMEVLKRITNAAIDAGKKIVSSVVDPIAVGGWNRASNIEQAKFQVRGLGYEWGQLSKQVDYAVKDTAYGLDSAAKVASQLLASGVQVGETFDAATNDIDEMGMSLRSISGVAAMTGSSYDEIGRIYATVAGNGRLMGDQLLQLGQRGLNAAAVLGKALNMTESEVREATSAGLIDFQTFSKAMYDAFGEQAVKANETFTGAMSNIKSAFARIGEIFVAPLIDSEKYETNAIGILNAVRVKINELKDVIKPIAEPWERFVNFIGPKIIAIINSIDVSPIAAITEKFGNFLDGITGFSDAARKSNINSFISDLVSHTVNLWETEEEANKKANETLSETVEGFADAAGEIKRVTEEEAKAAWDIWNYGTYGNGETRKRLLAEAGLEYKNVQGYVNALIAANFDLSKMEIEVGEAGTDAMTDVANATDKAGEKARRFGAAGTILHNLLITIKNVFTGFSQIVVSAFQAFREAFSFEGFGDGLVNFSEKLKELSEKLVLTEEKATKFKNIFKGAFSTISLVTKGVKKLASFILKILGPVFSFLFESFLSLSSGIGQSISDFREWLQTSEMVQRVVDALRGAIDRIIETFVAFKDKIVGFVDALKETEGFKRLSEELGLLIDAAKELAKSAFGKVLDRIEEFNDSDPKFTFLDNLINLLSNAMLAAADFIKAVRTGNGPIRKFINSFNGSDKISKFTGFIDKAKTSIKEFFENLDLSGSFKSFKESVKNIFNKIFDGINPEDMTQSFKDFFTKVGEELAKVNWDKIIDIAGKITLFVELFLLIKKIGELTGFIGAIVDSITGFFDALLGVADAAKRAFNSKVFVNIALGIVALAGAMFILSKIPSDRLQEVTIVMGELLLATIAMLFALSKIKGNAAEFASVGVMFAGIGVGFVLLAKAAERFAAMPNKALVKSGTVIVGLIGVFGICAKNVRTISKGALAFTGMALAIRLLIPAFYKFYDMDWDVVLKGGGIIVAFMFMMSAAAGLSGGSFGTALTITAIALAIMVLTPALVALSKIDTKGLYSAAGAIVAVAMGIGLAARIATKGGAGAILAMAVTVAAAAFALKTIADVEWKNLAVAALALFTVISAVALAAIAAEGNEKSLYALSVFVGVLGLVFFALCQLPVGSVAEVGVGLGVALLAVTASLKILEKMDWGAIATGTLKLLMIIGIVAAAFAAVSAAFGYFDQQTGGKVSDTIQAGVASLTAIGEAIGGFIGGIVGGFIGGAAQGISDALPKIGQNLSDFMTNLQGFIEGAKNITWRVFNGVTVLAACLLEIAAVESIKAMMDFLSFSKTSSIDRFASEITTLGQAISDYSEIIKNVDSAKVAASAYAGKMLAEFTDVIPNLRKNLGGDTKLDKLGRELVEFGPKMAEYGESIKDINTAKVTSSAQAGRMLAEFVDVIPKLKQNLEGDTKLDKFGDELVAFGPKMADYAESIKDIGPAKVDASARAAKALAEFAAAIPNEGGLWAELWGDNMLGSFGEQLAEFGPQFAKYARSVGKVNPEVIEATSAAAETITHFAKTIPNVGGKWAEFWGENSLEDFGAALPLFGARFYKYSEWMGKIEDVDVVSKTSAAAETITKFADTIPNMGGAWADFWGDNKLSDFGDEIVAFAEDFVDYSDAMKNVDSGVVTATSAAAETITHFANTIPVEVQDSVAGLTASSVLSTFGEELKAFAPAFVEYADKMSSINTDTIAATSAAAETITAFAVDIPSQSWHLFQGDKSLSTFGENLADFGQYFHRFATEYCAYIDAEKVTAVSALAVDIADFAVYLLSVDFSQLLRFGEGVENYGIRFYGFFSTLSNIDLSVVADGIARSIELVDMAGKTATVDTKSLDSFGASISTFGSKLNSYYNYVQAIAWNKVAQVVWSVEQLVGMAELINEKVNADSLAEFGDALTNIGYVGVDGFIAAFEDGENKASDTVREFVVDSSTSAEDNKWTVYSAFFQAGSYGGEGFYNGLTSWSYAVETAAYNMAMDAVNAAYEAMDAHSPSRKLVRLGEYADMGLINGFLNLADRVKSTAYGVGDSAVKSISDAIATISTENIDANPVITPVLDLSDVEQNASKIGQLFAGNSVRLSNQNGNLFNANFDNANLNTNQQVSLDDTNIVSELSLLRTEVGSLTDYISKLRIQLDSGALVGQLAAPMDDALGRRIAMAERGF